MGKGLFGDLFDFIPTLAYNTNICNYIIFVSRNGRTKWHIYLLVKHLKNGDCHHEGSGLYATKDV